jgi:hypothetical protein
MIGLRTFRILLIFLGLFVSPVSFGYFGFVFRFKNDIFVASDLFKCTLERSNIKDAAKSFVALYEMAKGSVGSSSILRSVSGSENASVCERRLGCLFFFAVYDLLRIYCAFQADTPKRPTGSKQPSTTASEGSDAAPAASPRPRASSLPHLEYPANKDALDSAEGVNEASDSSYGSSSEHFESVNKQKVHGIFSKLTRRLADEHRIVVKDGTCNFRGPDIKVRHRPSLFRPQIFKLVADAKIFRFLLFGHSFSVSR